MRTQIILVGRLGRDPETREAGESSVCSFSVATDRKVKGEKVTDWFNVSAWGKLGETCQQYLEKGSEAVIVGSLEPREYESNGVARMSLDVQAREVQFVGGKRESGQRSTDEEETVARTQKARQHESDERDEAVPF